MHSEPQGQSWALPAPFSPSSTASGNSVCLTHRGPTQGRARLTEVTRSAFEFPPFKPTAVLATILSSESSFLGIPVQKEWTGVVRPGRRPALAPWAGVQSPATIPESRAWGSSMPPGQIWAGVYCLKFLLPLNMKIQRWADGKIKLPLLSLMKLLSPGAAHQATS